jgi:hypothetical protein
MCRRSRIRLGSSPESTSRSPRCIPGLLVLLAPALLACSTASAQFWSCIGPQGGFYKDFAISGTVVLAGSDDSGGIWRTLDGGASWQILSSGFPDMTGWILEVSDENPDIVFACDAYGRWGLLRSSDGGGSWQQRTGGLSGMSELRVSGIAICSADADSLYISTGMDTGGDPGRPGNGIFVSSDGGVSWIPSGLQGMTVCCICRASNGKLFAGTHGAGLWKMGPGSGWTQVTGDVPVDAIVWQIDAEGPVVIAATLGNGIFLSTDTGASFTNYLPGQYCFDVAIARTSPIEAYASMIIDLLKYTAPSGTWTSVVSPPLSDSIIVMGLEAAGDTVWCGQFANSSPVVSHDGGASWDYAPSAPVSSYLTAAAVDPSNPSRLLASSLGSYADVWNLAGLFESTNLGASWERIGPAAHGLTIDFRPPSGSTVYFGTFADGLFRSADGGSSWSCIRPGRKVIFDVAIDPDTPLTMLESEYDLDASTVGLYRSTNGGDSFSPVLPALVSSALFAPGGSTVYAGTSSGVYRSLDDGAAWAYWRLAGVSIRSMFLHGGDVYAGGEMGALYRLPSAGGSVDITGPWGLPSNLDGILFSGETLYVGLSGAELDSTFYQHGSVWRSTDYGQSWTDLTGNLTTTHVYGSCPLVTAGGKLHACTYGSGLVRLDDGTSSPQEDPGALAGWQVRPVANPSGGTIRLELSVAMECEAELLVYDVTGRIVYSSGRMMLPAGSSLVDVPGLSIGAYFCILDPGPPGPAARVVTLP